MNHPRPHTPSSEFPRPAASLARRTFYSLALLAAAAGSVASVNAGETTAPTSSGKELTPAEKLRKPYFLTGDWGGVRQNLEDNGITFDLFETFDFYGNVTGGDHRALEYFARTRLTMDVDLEKLMGWKGGEFYISAVTQQGENFAKTKMNLYTNPSGIEGKQTTRLAEIWLQQKFFGEKIALKIGKIDGVNEFGVQELGSAFMNDELNYVTNQTFTAGMPFDPAGKPGAVLTLKPFDGAVASGFYGKVGIFAGNDNNAYFLDDTGTSFAIRPPAVLGAEIGFKTPKDSGLLPGTYKVGMHYNYGNTTRFDGTVADNNWFIYGIASQTLHYMDVEKNRHIDAGFSLGGAPGDRNKNYLEATAIVRITGPFASRPLDEIGLGFIISNFSHDFSEQNQLAGGPDVAGSEKTIEISYKAQINRWLLLQPDVQIVVDPIGDTHRSTALLLGMRTVILF